MKWEPNVMVKKAGRDVDDALNVKEEEFELESEYTVTVCRTKAFQICLYTSNHVIMTVIGVLTILISR